MKIRKIEEDLKTEYYKIIEDKEEDQPSVGKAKAPAPNKKFQEENEAEKKRKQL